MCNGGPVHADVVVIAKLQEFSIGKLGAIVGDDGVWHSKPVDDVCEKGHGLLCSEICDWVCLDPLGEFVHDNQQVGVALGRFSQGLDDVEPPHGEWPCDEYGLQGVSWDIGLAGLKLAPLTGAHDLVDTSDRGGPIEALVERIAHEGARRRVVATQARMDFSNKFATVGGGDAPLQGARRGALVQLVIDYSERLGFPGDAPSFRPIHGEFPSINLGEVLASPILYAGGRFCFHGLDFAHAIPLE
jgi:hypothetical protein